MRTMTEPLRILLVDDDPSFAMLVRSAMEMAVGEDTPYTLTILEDGQYAVQYITGVGEYADRSHHPLPHVMLLDQRMNQMDGADVLKELAADETARSIPKCIMSTSDSAKQRHTAYSLGATFCITKPLELEMLAEKMRLLVEFATRVLELPRSA